MTQTELSLLHPPLFSGSAVVPCSCCCFLVTSTLPLLVLLWLQKWACSSMLEVPISPFPTFHWFLCQNNCCWKTKLLSWKKYMWNKIIVIFSFNHIGVFFCCWLISVLYKSRSVYPPLILMLHKNAPRSAYGGNFFLHHVNGKVWIVRKVNDWNVKTFSGTTTNAHTSLCSTCSSQCKTLEGNRMLPQNAHTQLSM